jgi:predicted site-specific integrase-resolvase
LRVVGNNDPTIHFPTFRQWVKRGEILVVLQGTKQRRQENKNIQGKTTTVEK